MYNIYIASYDHICSYTSTNSAVAVKSKCYSRRNTECLKYMQVNFTIRYVPSHLCMYVLATQCTYAVNIKTLGRIATDN